MRHQALAPEKRVGTDPLGPVNDLVGDDEMPRGDFLPQRADGGKGNDGLAADMLERGNVGPRGDLGGRNVVRGAVARDEGDEGARGEGGDGDGGRGTAPGLVGVSGILLGLGRQEWGMCQGWARMKGMGRGDVQSQCQGSCYSSASHSVPS